jgi:hypothetical protein
VIGRGFLTAIVLLVCMGVAAVLVEVQSPSSLYWRGERVAAVSQGGIVFYRWHGQNYTIGDPKRGASDVRAVPETVYLDPDDPGQALVGSVTRWIDGGLVAVWFVAALALVPFGVVRQRRRRRRQAEFAAAG